MGRLKRKIQDSDLKAGDLYNDGEYSGKVKSVSSDEIVIESQNEDGDVVDITIPVTDDSKSYWFWDPQMWVKEKNLSAEELKQLIKEYSEGAFSDEEIDKAISSGDFSELDWREFGPDMGEIQVGSGEVPWEDDDYEVSEKERNQEPNEPNVGDIEEALMDPEFVSDMIDAASDGKNKVESYRDNGDGTVDVKIARPVTQEEAQYLNEVGIFVGLEGMNKAGWITVSANPISDSVKHRATSLKKTKAIKDAADPDTEWDAMVSKLWNGERVMKPEHWSDEDWNDFVTGIEDFELSDDNPEGTIMKQDGYTVWFETPGLEEYDDDSISDSAMSDYWIKVKRDLTRTLGGSWKLRESGNNGIKITAIDFPEGLEDQDVADFVTNNFPFRYDGKVGNDYLFIKDSALNVGDEYNDGKYAGVVTDITSDGISLESEDENGNKVEVTVPVSDSAVHTVTESNINDIFDKGTTTVVYDPEEIDPADIVMEIEDEIALGAAPGEEIPELDFEVIDDNTIEVFVV